MVRRTPTVTWPNPSKRVCDPQHIVPVTRMETTQVHSSQPAAIWTSLFKAETTVPTSWSQATAGLLRTDTFQSVNRRQRHFSLTYGQRGTEPSMLRLHATALKSIHWLPG